MRIYGTRTLHIHPHARYNEWPDVSSHLLPRSPCHKNVSGSVTASADGLSYHIELAMKNPVSPLCVDSYLFASLEGTVSIEHFDVSFEKVRTFRYVIKVGSFFLSYSCSACFVESSVRV